MDPSPGINRNNTNSTRSHRIPAPDENDLIEDYRRRSTDSEFSPGGVHRRESWGGGGSRPKSHGMKREDINVGKNLLSREAHRSMYQQPKPSRVSQVPRKPKSPSETSIPYELRDINKLIPLAGWLPTTADEVNITTAPHSVTNSEQIFEVKTPVVQNNTCGEALAEVALLPIDAQHYSRISSPTEYPIPGSWREDDDVKLPETVEFVPYEIPWIDQAKIRLERRLKTQILWWPLAPPVRAEPSVRLAKMTWRCSCGKRFSEVIEQAAVDSYRSIYHCAPAATNPSAPAIQATGHASPPAPLATPATPSVPPPSRRRHQRANDIPPLFQSGNAVISLQPVLAYPRIMCCVPQTQQHSLLAQLPRVQPQLSSDEQFFSELRGVYNRTRGWRRWFGLFCVTKVTYLRFSRYRIKHYDYTDCSHGPEGLPTIKDPEYNEYEFFPKPPSTPAAIPQCQLLHLFKDPSCAGTTSAVLANIPKRITGELPNDVAVAWGLQLQQTLCHTRVTCLFLVFWIPCMAFAGWWISENPMDLQNASVPGTMIATVTTVLVAILPAHFRHYQNLPSPAP